MILSLVLMALVGTSCVSTARHPTPTDVKVVLQKRNAKQFSESKLLDQLEKSIDESSGKDYRGANNLRAPDTEKSDRAILQPSMKSEDSFPYNKRIFDSLGGAAVPWYKREDSRIHKRAFDSLGGGCVPWHKRSFDSLGGATAPSKKRSFDSLGGASVPWHKRSFDSLGGASVPWHKRSFDSLGGASVPWHKRSFDSLGGASVPWHKRSLDSIGGATAPSKKRSFDSLGGASVPWHKRSFDSLGGASVPWYKREDSQNHKRQFDKLGGAEIPSHIALPDLNKEKHADFNIFSGDFVPGYKQSGDETPVGYKGKFGIIHKRQFDSLGGGLIPWHKRGFDSLGGANVPW